MEFYRILPRFGGVICIATDRDRARLLRLGSEVHWDSLRGRERRELYCPRMSVPHFGARRGVFYGDLGELPKTRTMNTVSTSITIREAMIHLKVMVQPPAELICSPTICADSFGPHEADIGSA